MKYLGHLVESSTDAIVSFNPDRRVATWNRGARNIYGYREEEVLGREWDFLAAPGEREKLQELLRGALSGKEAQSQEVVFTDREGSHIPVNVSFSQIRDSQGKVVGLSAITQDLREKKKMIELLVQTEKLAEIGRMGSGIVHEIKNPLTSIMMMSDTISTTKGLPPKTVKYSLIIQKETQRILRLTRNILSFARPKKAEMDTTDLNQALEETLDLVEYELKKAVVGVQRELDETVPPVWADREKLKQVFLNIIANAGHAALRGGKIVIRSFVSDALSPEHGWRKEGWECLAVGELDSQKSVAVEVEDYGAGIPPELVPRIFEPFFSTKGEGKGTGLGLYVARNIVLEHLGRIEVRSREGEGTVFTVHLPVREEGHEKKSGPRGERLTSEGYSPP
jgi:PAS domain S-box-containing protein